MELREFLKAKKELEKLHNDYCTQLRQEMRQHELKVQNVLNGLNEQIKEAVQQELNAHLPIVHEAIERIHRKIEKHFGP